MAALTPLEKCKRRHDALIFERTSTWDAHYREIADYILPWKSRFMANERNKGNKRGTKIISPEGRKHARTAAQGLFAGTTNPARKWFNLESFDPDLMDDQTVKQWLERQENKLNLILNRSNFYNVMPSVFAELVVFCTAPFMSEEDYEDVATFRPFTVGEYAIGQNQKGRVNAFTREFEHTVENHVAKFGLQNISAHVRSMYDRGDYDKAVKVFHLVEENHGEEDYKKFQGMVGNKKFRGLYWEERAFDVKGESGQFFNEVKGYYEFPVHCPRWDTNSGDTYGNGPGFDGLAEVKQLQVLEKRKLQRLEKANNPPMQGPQGMRNERSSTLPGDMTYVPDNASQKYQPTYMVDANIESLRREITEKKRDIAEIFYADLFRMMLDSDRKQITAREVAERHEEKLLLLGPALININGDGLDPCITRLFNMAQRADLFDPMPEALQNQPMTVRYSSILSQAQRMVDAGSIERMATFVTTLGPANPEVLDKFDFDEAVDKYQEITGAPVAIVVSTDKANEKRAARAESINRQQQLQLGAQAIDSAKTLSDTNTGQGTALAEILGL